jgi:hypothetical protein
MTGWIELAWVPHLTGALLVVVCAGAASHSAAQEPTTVERARRAAADGDLVFRLTTPDELKALLGAPTEESTRDDGGMEELLLSYSGMQAKFGRMRNHSTPFTLWHVGTADESLDIGQERQIVLRTVADLERFDAFWGLAGVSLANLDLRGCGALLEEMPFDSRTAWPGTDKLPEGCDLAQLLEDRKNPGLGIRSLHAQGVDGRGVGIAIIDQPMLQNHVEYADRIVRYEEIGVHGVGPQMHGPPVTSIAAGRTCGVAPAVSLTYFATPSWKADNTPYCDAIDQILAWNETAGESERVRVVSISTGMFGRWAHHDRWQETLVKAEQHGILVITCAGEALAHGMAGLAIGGDPDNPHDYGAGQYGVASGSVLVPASNRTTASHEGPEVYTFWRESGRSWATPYVAGVAALGCQVHPDISPGEIVRLLKETATATDAGRIINPPAFVQAARELAADAR